VLAAGRRAAREGSRVEEGGKKGKKEKEKGKRKREKEKEERRGKKEKGKMGRKIEKKRRKNRGGDFGKIRKIVRENWEGFCGVSPGLSGVVVIFGSAMMARRTSRRDRGVRGIPGRWPTVALGRRAGVRPGCGAGGNRGTRVGERERENSG
jgi:hypothetical protein